MRPILLILACLAPRASAQDAKPSAAAEEKKPDTPAPAASPVPSTESWLIGSIDLGYQWLTGPAGSVDTYRSIVNLDSGIKLLGADFVVLDPKHRVFDRLHVRATNWGEDAYSTLHVNARKGKHYDFNADYRDFAYYNFLPSYADPLLSRGIQLNEQSFDTRRRFASFTLELRPGNWWIPYVAYDRDSSSGTGSTAFVATGNEYAVPTRLSEATNLLRGGVRLELRRFHATLEEGGTRYSDDQSVFQNPGSVNLGNLAGSTTLNLSSLLATYGIQGSSAYTKALFTGAPKPWLDLYGQFLYSQPSSDVSYQQTAAGALQNQLLLYSSQQFLLTAAAKLPHTTASLGAEIRPLRRVRIVESWLTDRLHNAGSASSTLVLAGGNSLKTASLLASSLASNYNQEEVDVFVDVNPKLMLRGGYRYVWGDSRDATLPLAGLAATGQGTLKRNVGLGAITYRPKPRFSVTAEAEGASSGGAYFRTSLYDYQKVRAQVRYAATAALSLSADATFLNNQNPTAGVNYDYMAKQTSLSLFWSPASVKVFDMQASYTRSTIRSHIGYLAPQDGTPLTSLYRENGHIASALFNLKMPEKGRFAPKLSAGGSFFVSTGSRPTSYFQPLATMRLPLAKKVSWFAEWRYYGYGEAFYLYEGFRAHLVATGLRFTR